MDGLLKDYLEKIKSKKLSYNTLSAYERDIKSFIDFLSMRGEVVTEVTDITVLEYMQILKAKEMKDASLARNLASLRNFYKYLNNASVVSNNPFTSYSSPKINHVIAEILTPQETEKLLNMPDLKTLKGIRDKAMLELMYATGIKVTELILLNLENINLKLNYIICTGTKNKERLIPIGKYASKFLSEYIEIRSDFLKTECKNLFVNSKGAPMSRQGFWKILNGYVEAAEIKKNISPQTIRHSFAVHLLQNGADLKSVQELLGYSNLSAIEIYFSVLKKNKIFDVYNNSHPRA